MKGYAKTEIFEAQELMLQLRAQELVDKVPDVIGNELVRCHELARAVGHVLKLEVVNGLFGAVEHSWLKVSSRTRESILDVYTPGVVPQVLLIDTFRLLPWRLYEPGPVRNDIKEDVVERLIEIMRD